MIIINHFTRDKLGIISNCVRLSQCVRYGERGTRLARFCALHYWPNMTACSSRAWLKTLPSQTQRDLGTPQPYTSNVSRHILPHICNIKMYRKISNAIGLFDSLLGKHFSLMKSSDYFHFWNHSEKFYSSIEARIFLSWILCADAPIVSLRPGRNLDLARVQEGDDVYFECDVEANPPVTGRIQWKHNVRWELYFAEITIQSGQMMLWIDVTYVM